MKYVIKYLISFLFAFFFVLLTFVLSNFLKENEKYKIEDNFPNYNVRYEVEECDISRAKDIDKFYHLYDYIYDKINKTLVVKILVNCCTNISVKKYNSEYLIFEDRNICTCMCYRRIKIFDVDENSKIIFISNNKRIIISPNLEFCGFSTFGKCISDLMCLISGCSFQVCQSILDGLIATTCEYRDCYNYSKFNLSCKCIDNMCQWI
jgi:eight-cysteine-cluster-containing protein